MTTIAEVEKQIEALGPGTPEYHEAMAFYLMTMARAQWRQADAARLRNRRKDTLQRFKDSERAR